MHTFNKKQVAVAVSAALTAFGAVAAAPALRASNPVLAIDTGFTQAKKQSLYTAAGLAGAGNAITIEIGLGDSTGTTLGHVRAVDSAGTVTTSTAGLLVTDSATRGADLSAYVLDSASAKVLINALFNSTATLIGGDSTKPSTISLTLTTAAATDGVRFNAGKLQYSANATSTAPTWRDVNIDILPSQITTMSSGVADSGAAAGNVTIFTDESTGTVGTLDSLDNALAAAITGKTAAIGKSLVPTAVAYTRATSGLVDGVKIETFTPLASFAATNVITSSVATGDVNKAAAIASGVTAQLVSGATTTYEVFFSSPTTVDWVDTTLGGAVASDAAAYTAKTFNTGISGATVPFKFSTDSTTTKAAYTLAFDSTGTAVTMDSTTTLPAQAAFLDGVAPTVIKAEYVDNGDTTSNLQITFSEGIGFIDTTNGATGQDNLREILENISHKVSGTSTTLAAEAFNANVGIVAALGAANSVANSLLTLTGVPKVVLDTGTAHTVEIGKRISVADPGDAAFSTADKFDTEGGLKGTSATIADSTGLTANALNSVGLNTITATGTSITKFNAPATFNTAGGVSARAFSNPTDTSKIHSVVASFSGGVALASGANLKDQFVLDQKDSNGTPYASAGQSNFKFYPDSTAVTVDSAAGTVTIVLPTDLNAVTAKDTWTLTYLGSTQLVNKVATAYQGNTSVNVTLPFTAAGLKNTLTTMDAKLKFTGAAAGSRVTTYLAKWLDSKQSEVFDSAAGTGISVTGGKITDPGNKVATDVALFDSTGTTFSAMFGTLVAAELNKAKPGLITAYIGLELSNNSVSKPAAPNDSTGTNMNNRGVGGKDFMTARAWINTDRANVLAADRTVYEVQIDPVSGAISGRLNGNFKITAKKGGGTPAGLAYIKTDGKLINAHSDSTGAIVQNDATKYAQSQASQAAVVLDATNTARIFIGADVSDPKVLEGAFLLSVLEQSGVSGVDANMLVTSADPAAANHVPFVSSLSLKDPTKVLRTDLGDFATANIRTVSMVSGTNWQLLGLGNLDRKTPGAVTPATLPRMFVSYTPGSGLLQSVWANGNDGDTKDAALTMLGNNVGLAGEATDGSTNSTINIGANVKGNAAGLALLNAQITSAKLPFLTKTALASFGGTTGMGLPAGWSLISMPSGVATTAALPADISMVLKVGAQAPSTGQISWVTGDSAVNLSTNEPVFVFAKKAIVGK